MMNKYDQALEWERQFGVSYAFNRVLDFLREPEPIPHAELRKNDIISIDGSDYIVTDIRSEPYDVTQHLTLQKQYEPSVDIKIRSK